MIRKSLPTPGDWPLIRLKYLYTKRRELPTEDGIVTAFRDGVVTLRNRRREDGYTEALKEIGYQRVRRGDLVVSSMDGAWGAIGVSDSDGRCTPVYSVCIPTDNVDPRFHAYWLRSAAHSGFLLTLAKGIRERSTALDFATLADLPVPNTSLKYQKAVADFLDRETSRIDAVASKKKELGHRVEEWLGTRVALAIDGCGEFSLNRAGLPILTSRYEVARLGFVADVQTGLTLDAARGASESDVTLPYLRVANVQDGWLDLDEVKEVTVAHSLARRCTLQPGDVLMTEGGDPDKLGRGTLWEGQIPDCLHQNHIFAVRTSKDRVSPRFLALLTRTPYARVYFEVTASKTTGIASTSTAKIASWRIPIPPLREQEEIVERVTAFSALASRLQATLRDQLRLLDEHRKALITAAVTGQIDVTKAA